MVNAIIFDCFGVLATEGWLPFKEKYFGHDQNLKQQATDLLRQANSGLISYEDFLQAISKLAGITPAEVDAAIDNNIVANEPLFDYIATLKPKHKIGLLSNVSGNWLSQLFTPGQMSLMDATSLSFETGYIKPQAQAYQYIADKLGVGLAECVYVDDKEIHCAAARAAGMQAVLYKDFDQFKKELKPLLLQ